MKGFVSFVSSGPGDPGLITVKAADRLRQADVILYDHLSRVPARTYARADALLLYVGKRAGQPSVPQAEINRLLVEHAKMDGRVVRLKSGDAGIFGRLEEEIAAIQTAGIGFEIIPGVSAASAAAAAAGMPMTRRMTARRVQFFTGHDASGDFPDDMNIAALADPSAISVVYMARATFPKLAARLIAAGLPADTPALLAEGVSTANERISFLTLEKLARHLDTPSPVSHLPAIIFYGALATPLPAGD